MQENSFTGYIRVKVICVFKNGNRILVGDAYDNVKQEVFYCPPGGRVEFGETTIEALRREMMEELGSEILKPQLLGVIENLFTFEEEKGHEIVFVYNAELKNRNLYDLPEFKAMESNGVSFNAIWIDINSVEKNTSPVYPAGLIEMVKNYKAD